MKTEAEVTTTSALEESRRQIDQLLLTVSRKDDERALLRERLNEVELELREALDYQTSATAQLEAFQKEKDSLAAQYQSDLDQK